MRDLVDFHKPIGMRHKLGLSRGASIHCQQAREIGSQRGQGVFERGQKSGGESDRYKGEWLKPGAWGKQNERAYRPKRRGHLRKLRRALGL